MAQEETETKESLRERVVALEAELARLRESARTHAALHRQDATYYQMLVESMSEGLAIQDEHGRIVYANGVLCQMFGVSRSDILGVRARDFVSPKDLIQYDAQMTARRAGARERYELSWRTADGSEVRTLLSPSPIYDDEGNYRGAFAVITNLTEYRQAQEALQASENRCREVLEHSRDVAYKVDLLNARFEYISPSTTELTGYSPEDVVEMGPSGLEKRIHPDDLAAYGNYGQRLWRGAHRESPVAPCEYRVRCRNGNYKWFSDSASLVMDTTGQAIARIGTLRDITLSKEAEEAVRAASRMEATKTLAGGIAHEFNNLMTCVLGNAELLELRLAQTPDSKRMLQAIAKAAEQAGGLARQMLAFARGGAYQPAVLDLNGIIEAVLRLENHLFSGHVSVEQILAGDLWHVKADRTQLAQVITNLTVNAVEAIPENGAVTIRTCNVEADGAFAEQHHPLKPGRYVCLTITDTGTGMADDVRERIFDPFFTTKFQGRGLGLAAVHGIVQNHQGLITVKSEEGKGSAFQVYLPASEGVVQTRPEPFSGLQGGSETVLVVDDEAMIRTTTRHILERLGYRVLEAVNGLEAVELVRNTQEPIDLVLLDMAMPVMGGAEAFIRIYELRPGIKVVLCSGYELGAAAQETLDRGARSFLQKPFRIQAVAAEIRRVLDERID